VVTFKPPELRLRSRDPAKQLAEKVVKQATQRTTPQQSRPAEVTEMPDYMI